MHSQYPSRRESNSSSSICNIRSIQKPARRNPVHILFLLALFALVSCGKDGPTWSTSPANMVVTPKTVTLTAIGQSVQLDAQVQDEAGTTLSGQAVVWSSRNPLVASVSSGGLVTAKSKGIADVTATAGQKQAKSTITVTQSARTITVEP